MLDKDRKRHENDAQNMDTYTMKNSGTAEHSDSVFLTLGVDIGTTTVSAVVLDAAAGIQRDAFTVPHDAAVPGTAPWDRRQDVRTIMRIVRELTDTALARYPDIRAVGFTGQMHGILYLGADGAPLSDLYTWQDGRAGISEEDGVSLCERLEAETGYRLSPGYGLATHGWNVRHGLVPEGARRLCTIMDYAAAALCGTSPVCHPSNAASLGFFDADAMCFDTEALRRAGIEPELLPEVAGDDRVVGTYRGIPVVTAIGDNQAGVFGTLGDRPGGVLANFGTGSQISVIRTKDSVRGFQPVREIELRPFLSDRVLVCGSALCGGRAYAVMERFFRAYQTACGYPEEEQYEVMNRLALSGIERMQSSPENVLRVCTAFCGTRADPALRGEIANISEDNFTPENLVAGTLYGMAEELFSLYRKMPESEITAFAASGNAVRKNEALRRVLCTVFGREVKIPVQREEAAYGAAMFALRAAYSAEAERYLHDCIRYL